MKESSSDSTTREGFSRNANLWIQSLALVLAGVFSFYQFIYLQYVKPNSAPVNLSTEVTIHQAGARQGQNLTAVQLEVTASNPSTRTVYVLDNYWVATGINVGPLNPANAPWAAGANQAVANRVPFGAGAHYMVTGGRAVAYGSIIPDSKLEPGETVTRSYVFYVPQNAYDMIDVESALPSVSEEGAATVKWELNQETGAVTPKVHLHWNHIDRDLTTQEDIGAYQNKRPNLQMVTTRNELSLWDAANPQPQQQRR